MLRKSPFGVWEDIPDSLKKGLLYSAEDVEASREFVLICPYKRLQNNVISTLSGFDDPGAPPSLYPVFFVFLRLSLVPDTLSDSNVMEFFQIVPGDNPDLGDYRSKDPADTNNYTVISYGNCLIISYIAHLIMKQAAPAVKPYMIYALSRKVEGSAGHIPGVDYGPVNEIAEQYACWLAICGSVPAEDWGHFWRNLLTQEGKTDEEILLDAWRGPGNMWVFVRPDRYIISLPIRQSTEQAQDFRLQRLSRRCH